MNGPILKTKDLRVGYGDRAVVDAITLAVRGGQILSLIGPNGAGKSTILKTLLRQLPAMSGAVWLDGQDLRGLSHLELARTSAAVLTERPRPELMRCADVVAAGRYPHTGRLGLLSEEDRRIVRETMALVGVTDIAEQDFDRISDGQRQRIMLARAICQEPKLLILDEPTSFLDIRNKLEFLTLLRDLVRRRRLAVVMSMHELDLAQTFSDLVACVRGGRIERVGTPEEIFTAEQIRALYDVAHGSFDPRSGAMVPKGVSGAPVVFVIGGGGSGVPVYRRLWRLGVPFAAGVLQENDLDTPTAQALAAAIVTERAFESIGETAAASARDALLRCRAVLCPLERFGSMNRENERLRELAAERGLLLPTDVSDAELLQLTLDKCQFCDPK